MKDETTVQKCTIKLSSAEFLYLENAKFLPEDLRREITKAEISHGKKRILKLDPEIAERFRDEFTVRLSEVGFDANYDLTNEGTLLEELIDLFWSAMLKQNL